MSEGFHWVLEVSIKPGELDNFKSVIKEAIEATQTKFPGTAHYRLFINEDGSKGHIDERFTDSAAAAVHLTAFGENFAERFLATAEPGRFVVYGNPNDEIRQVLDGFGPIYMEQIAGFVR